MKITIAATSAPISGRARNRPTSDRRTRGGAAAGACGGGEGGGCVSTDEVMVGFSKGFGEGSRATRSHLGDYGVLFAVNGTILSMLLLSTMDGRVRTGPPPPMSLPL